MRRSHVGSARISRKVVGRMLLRECDTFWQRLPAYGAPSEHFTRPSDFENGGGDFAKILARNVRDHEQSVTCGGTAAAGTVIQPSARRKPADSRRPRSRRPRVRVAPAVPTRAVPA